ncbi:MAG: glycosyltransferase [Oscillospiraceae bacterium]|nr:glycosyltransferase [Oscillospiraceae bacterium]
MKKHLAVLCGVYYPSPSPTGLCTKRYLSLLTDSYDIDVICISSCDAPKQAEENGIRVHALLGKRMQLERRGSTLTRTAAHVIGGAQMKTAALGNLAWFRKQALEVLNQLHRRQPLDAVFSVCSPFAAHAAAKAFKQEHPTLRWCAYTVDPYAAAGRVRPLFYGKERLAAFERSVCACADVLLLSEEVYNAREDLRCCADDCRRLPYLLPKVSEAPTQNSEFSNAYIHCVYAGRFYPKIRNPEPMLAAFHAVSDPDIRLHLYSTGCEDTVRKYAALDSRILLHAPVSHEKIGEIYRSADCLINIENSLPEFLPSKLFEYIAACRPIISFGSGQSRELLSKHPAALHISNAEDAEKNLQAFIEGNRGKVIPAAEIESSFRHHGGESIRRILERALSKSVDTALP